MIDADLLAILACPACDNRPPLSESGDWLVCEQCGRRYPVVNGIPHLLVEEAVGPTTGQTHE